MATEMQDTTTSRYRIREDSGAEQVIEAADMSAARAAAAAWAADGDYDQRVVVSVRVAELDADGEETDAVEWVTTEAGPEPEEPACDSDDDDHEWQAIHALVGGCAENPGVHSLGGTAMSFRTVCVRCGTYRVEVHAGSQRNPDELPVTVHYEDADAVAREWIAAHAED